jgi:hypothetical protein
MKKLAIGLTCVAIIGVVSFTSRGQDDSPAPPVAPLVVTTIPKPQTRLEAMYVEKGAVLVRGYTDIGTLQGEDGSSLRVTAVEIADSTRGTRQTGLALQVASRNRDHGATSFIDIEDVKSLLEAIDSIAKIDHAVTRLSDFETSYRTRGDLEIANIRTGHGRLVTVGATQILPSTGQVLSGVASFRVSRLADLRQAIVAAQEALEQAQDQQK